MPTNNDQEFPMIFLKSWRCLHFSYHKNPWFRLQMSYFPMFFNHENPWFQRHMSHFRKIITGKSLFFAVGCNAQLFQTLSTGYDLNSINISKTCSLTYVNQKRSLLLNSKNSNVCKAPKLNKYQNMQFRALFSGFSTTFL